MAAVTYGLCRALSWLAILGKEKGLFRGEGLDIDFRTFPTGRTAALALQKGWVDCANIIDANVAFLALETKPKIRLLHALQVKDDAGILARADAGIAVSADLAGKRLAYLPKTSSHMFLVRFCAHHGLDMDRMDLAVMNPEQMPDALLRGTVDAFSAWEPFRTHTRLAAAQAELPLQAFANDCGYRFHVVLAATEKAVRRKVVALEQVVSALRRAARFAAEEPEESARILAADHNLSPPVFERMREMVTLDVTPIPHDFTDQVLTQMMWLRPGVLKNYENILTGLSAP